MVEQCRMRDGMRTNNERSNMKHVVMTSYFLLAVAAFAARLPPTPEYMDAKSAVKAHADFPLVGEYVATAGGKALQANMLKDGTFLVAEYQKGLPGAGWDGSAIASSVKTAEELKAALAGFKKAERTSVTMGKRAPTDAVLKFPDDVTNVKDGIMLAGAKTKKNLRSFKMHLEFKLPFKPGRNASHQDRGNSGIYIFNNYEVQVMDCFSLDYRHPENNAIKLESNHKQWCGALYKMKLPDVNMCYPPLRWQTYDIEFTAPEFEGGKKVKNARISVRHNGTLIHDDVELMKGTGAGAGRKQLAEGPVFFQAHGNKVMYRNVWAVGK